MKKILVFALALVTMLSLASCSLLLGGGDDPDAVQTVESSESSLTLEVPASWNQTELSEHASIEMATTLGEQGIVVFEEAEEGFADSFTLADYASRIFESMSQALDVPESTEITDAIVGSDIPAKQFEIGGSAEGVNLKYMVVCVKVGGIYYQMDAMSALSEYDEAKAVFDKIFASVNFDPEVLAAEEEAPIDSDPIEGQGDTSETQTITSTESSISLTFPADWYEADYVPDAAIEMETGGGAYVVLFENPREGFVDGYTLDEYSTMVYEGTPPTLEEPEASEIIDITIGAASIPAKQFEISGAGSGVISKYQITCAEIEGIFCQFTMGSGVTDYDTFKPVFDEILASVAAS